MSTLLERLKANATAQAARPNAKPTEVVDCTVLDIRPTQQTATVNGVELKKVMVVTKEFGNLFPFENSVVGSVTVFPKEGIKARVTLQENNYKNSEGVDVAGFNTQRVVIEAISPEREAMIKALPKGAALFAM